MIIFHSTDLTKQKGSLIEEEFRHCAKVLRYTVGDAIHLTDGKGLLATGVVSKIEKRSVLVDIDQMEHHEELAPHIRVAVSFPKNAARVDFLIEKLVELGVNKISPIVSHHSERRKLKLERLRKKIVSASTQSGHMHFPVIDELVTLKTLLASIDHSSCLYCHYQDKNPQLITSDIKGKEATIIIGPEGDFSKQELTMMNDFGIKAVNIGNHRLRTETAAIAACTIWRMMNEN